MFRTLGRNMPYLRQQGLALLNNTSTSVKVVCVIVVLSYGLSYFEDAIRILSITPEYLMPPRFWIWTAFTFCFLEIHFWEVLVDIVTVGLCGKLIEPLWGQTEQLIFFATINLSVAIITTIFYYILYVCTFNTDYIFHVSIHGLSAYIAGVSVAVKQIMPDLIILRTPLGKLSNRNIPLSVFLISLFLWLIGFLESTYPTMFFSGLIVSWIYLRFYQKHSNGTCGDMADNFSFASFFPNVIQPPIALLSNTVHNFFVRIGLCRKVIRKFDLTNPSGISVSISNPTDQQDIERRRHIALKALSERLYTKSYDIQPLIPKSDVIPKSLLPPKFTHIETANSSIDDKVVIDMDSSPATTSTS